MSEMPRFPMPSLENDLFLRVANGLPVARVPVWIMRQAGRTDPQYLQLREEDGRPLEAIFLDAEQSIRISLLPQRIGVDAIIMFQDILTPLAPIGAPFHFCPGPEFEQPVRQLSQVRQLQRLDPPKDVPSVGKILKGLLRKLKNTLPVLGFAGSPMTLAFFLIAGKSPGSQTETVLHFIQEQPEVTLALLDHLTLMTIDYLNYQIESGAHAVQLFESFGDVLPRPIYERYVLPTHQRIFSELSATVPSILFVKECPFLDLMFQSEAPILSVGSCIDLKDAMEQSNQKIIFQGNVPNQILLSDPGTITEAVETCLKQTGKRNHILNLNHGLLANTPFEHVQHFIKIAKTLGQIDLL